MIAGMRTPHSRMALSERGREKGKGRGRRLSSKATRTLVGLAVLVGSLLRTGPVALPAVTWGRTHLSLSFPAATRRFEPPTAPRA